MNDQFEGVTNLTREACKDGIIVSVSSASLSNAILYLLALLYCFLGIAIVADVFMCSIEKITSSTRKVKLKRSNSICETADPEEGVEVRVWNPTVANLSLMAVGSSAPEILLSVIEITTNHFRIGDLGPGTIVGSAAFNLLCITAVCILAVPSPKVKRIQETFVFATTSLFSCLAYIWLLFILVIISPDIVELWEALVTFGLLFILIIVAYLVDIKIWKRNKTYLDENYQIDGVNDQKRNSDDIDIYLRKFVSEMESRNDMVKTKDEVGDHETLHYILRWISRVYPHLSVEEQSKLLASKLKQLENRGRLWYRLHVMRRLAAASRKMDLKWSSKKMLEEADRAKKTPTVEGAIEFSARVYSISEGNNKVIRHEPTDKTVAFRYSTKNGVAKKDVHFLAKSETVQFKAGEKIKEIYIDLVEDATWRPGDVFYVCLKLVENNQKSIIGETNVARVQIVDDSSILLDKPVVQFVKNNYVVKENQKYVRAFVTCLGRHNESALNVCYETEAVTAKCDKDYEGISEGVLTFVGNEYEKYIDVRIYDDMNEEKDETFNIHLIASAGGVTIGPNKCAVVTIICDDNILKNITNVRKLTSYYFKQVTYGSNTWLEQLIQATCVNAGDVENATLVDCVLHILSFPWKVMAALIPPATILGGWLAFFCALVLIGFITAVIGDLASIFGCMIGLKDAITAITLVALGTSLPDTFASKIAAENDITADNAIGNITGSNAVNVFLGLGLPWTIAAIYWSIRNEIFVVNAGSLGFSVAIFMAACTTCMVLLIARRVLAFFGKGELGGPVGSKVLSASILVILWLGYVLLSALQTYDYISI
uniref:Sodium/calcium exchanger 3 n=1 Tax=Elaeophora elaphi TaxID=1147741 RepID=A0A0R3RQV3_9BILA